MSDRRAGDCTVGTAGGAAHVAERDAAGACAPWLRPGLAWIGAGAALGAIATAGVLAFLPPAGRPMVAPDPETRGMALEQALAAAFTRVRPDDGRIWAIAIDPADLNAWLATRLPKWIAHDPSLAEYSAATEVRIGAVDGALVVEAPVGPEALGLVGTVRVPIELVEAGEADLDGGAGDASRLQDAAEIDTRGRSRGSDGPGALGGRLRVAIGGAAIGRLPLPMAEVAGAAAARLVDEISRLAARHSDRRIPLADGRRVEVRAISCEAGRIKLRLETLPASATAPTTAPTTSSTAASEPAG